MNIKKLTLYIIVILCAFQSIHSANIETLDLITAQPNDIAQAIKPHTIKLLAAKALDAGLANIPLANLKELLAHEQLAAKIVSRMNYINDITKENVHLFIKPVGDNFEHINQHTFDWILYLNRNDFKPIIPVITNCFSTIIQRNYGTTIILKILEIYPACAEQFVQPAIDNFLSLANDTNGCYIIAHIMKLSPDTAKLFTQHIIDNFTVLTTYEGQKVLLTIVELHPDALKQFIQPAINNFTALTTWYPGLEIILKIMELYPDTIKQFIKPAVDNFTSLATGDGGRKILLKIIKLYPETAKQFVQAAIDNLAKLVNSYYGTQTLLKIMEMYPHTIKQFVQPAIDNYWILSNTYYGKELLAIVKADGGK